MRRFLPLLVILLLAACVGPQAIRFPARRCLYDDGRLTRYRPGTATMQRADGAILFRFDDPEQGDHGTYWFEPTEPGGTVDIRGKRLMPCKVATADPWGEGERR